MAQLNETQNLLNKINEGLNSKETEPEAPEDKREPKNKTQEENDDNFQGKVKMKNYTSFNSSIQEKELFSYYCALCGALALVTNSSLEKMPLRSSDSAIVINRKEMFCKLYMKKSGCVYIKRKKGLEPQFRWRCECGVLIGYQAISFEESDNLTDVKKNQEDMRLKNKPFLYVLNDAIVLNMHSSSLIQMLSEYVKMGK